MESGNDDEAFAPRPAPVRGSRDVAPPAASIGPRKDPRSAAIAIAQLLLAAGSPSEGEVARANAGLSALGRPPLAAADATGETPEQIAPRTPSELRAGVLELMYLLAGDEPIRRRIADSYALLWREHAEEPPAPREGSRLVRWMIGTLPRHQAGETGEEDEMIEHSPYRGEPVAPQVAIVERSPLRDRVAQIQREFHAVIAAVEQVIVGKREVIARVLTAMAARGHVLLVDVPGVGKTQLCKAIAAAIETRFGRIQFTPDLLPMDITGANVFDVRDKQFHFRHGPVFTHLLLADEINRATPKSQSALLEVMEERSVTIDGTSYHVEEPFTVLATMNPIDHQGTYPLPAAQIDRFTMRLEIGLPSPDDEVRVLDTHLAAESPLASLRPVISREAFIAWRDTVPHIHVTPALKRAAVDYLNGLRRGLDEGQTLSPRATLAWVRCAQAHAMLQGRDFVTLEDLLTVGADVIAHRMGLDTKTVRGRLRAIQLPRAQ